MKFEAKAYKRIGAMVGSIIGVLAMIVAVCMGKTFFAACLLVACACAGVIVGSVLEKAHGDK